MRRGGLGRSMADEAEEVYLREGMPVSNEAGEALGSLAALLVAEDEEEAEFLLVANDGTDRLVPFEAVLGVGDDQLILDVPHKALGEFPVIRSGVEPTDDEMELAYHVYDEHAQYESDEE